MLSTYGSGPEIEIQGGYGARQQLGQSKSQAIISQGANPLRLSLTWRQLIPLLDEGKATAAETGCHPPV
jgi:hypothetical protein